MLPAIIFGTEIPGLNLKPGCDAPRELEAKSDLTNKITLSKRTRRTRAKRRGLDDRSWEFSTE